MGAETPKQFLELDGVPIAVLSVRRIASCPLVTQIIVATRQAGIEKLETRLRQEKFNQPVRVIKGGDSRQESVAVPTWWRRPLMSRRSRRDDRQQR